MTDAAAPSLAAPPEAAREIFADRLPLATMYAQELAGPGLSRGMIGPREVPRLWDRHLLNCAVVTDLFPAGARVVDVGSGAGLPGLALAIRRPDLRVDCVESIRRRTDFLTEVVATLGLEEQVRVIRGRIEDAAVLEQVGDAEWLTARAVAPIGRLVGWSLPALRVGGCLLALKGATAAAELAEAQSLLRRSGADSGVVVEVGVGVLDQPTTVIAIRRTGQHRPAVRRKGRG